MGYNSYHRFPELIWQVIYIDPETGKTQIWTAIATYVLIAIVKKRLNLDHSLYEILRVLDLNMFETTPISAPLGKLQNGPETDQEPLQQNLFPKLGH